MLKRTFVNVKSCWRMGEPKKTFSNMTFAFRDHWVILCVSDGDLLYANLGDNITLPCFYPSASKHLSWYKQVAGQQPQIISSFYKPVVGSNKFVKEFQGNKRFSVHVGEGFYNLNISHVQDSDSAMYYCGHTSVTVTVFENGTFLRLKGSVPVVHIYNIRSACCIFFSQTLLLSM